MNKYLTISEFDFFVRNAPDFEFLAAKVIILSEYLRYVYF